MDFIHPTKTLFLCAALASSFAALGCQTFEMDEVKPSAVAAEQRDTPIVGAMDKSFIMLVIDKSGSMLNGVANPNGSCKDSSSLGYNRDGDCRWNSLLDAFAGNGSSKGFLRKSLEANNGEGSALFGLATYPTGDRCNAGSVQTKLSETKDNVETIIDQLNKIKPQGGTPTAPTLNALLSQDPLLSTPSNTRKRFVMLLTDGAPNCNATASNKQRCDACNAARNALECNSLESILDLDGDGTPETMGCYPINTAKVSGQGTTCDTPYITSDQSMYGTDCLDTDQTVEAIKALQAVGVDTFVIGFGNTAAEPATKLTLNRAAIAGGRPVGNDGDDIRFYEATDTESLSAALEAILNATTGCTFQLDPRPRSCDEVQVKMRTVADDSVRTLVSGTEWTCTEGADTTVLEILDTPSEALCSDKLMTSPANTYELQFFYSVDL